LALLGFARLCLYLLSVALLNWFFVVASIILKLIPDHHLLYLLCLAFTGCYIPDRILPNIMLTTAQLAHWIASLAGLSNSLDVKCRSSTRS
jgi:hypothetical protein